MTGASFHSPREAMFDPIFALRIALQALPYLLSSQAVIGCRSRRSTKNNWNTAEARSVLNWVQPYHRVHFLPLKIHPSAPQRNNVESQHTSAPSTTVLPSQIQPAAFGRGFSATSLTRRSSSFLTLQSGRAHTSSYLRTRRPGNSESSSLFANVPVGQTRLVSQCLSSTTTMPLGRNAWATFGAMAFVGSYVRTIRSHFSMPKS
jgi:hypothetical protein